MKKFLKGLFAVSIIPLVMIGCTTSSHKGQTITTPDGKRIFIPQE
ncbi:MAG: peptidase M15, partial [Acinetobacter sp.]|nr:peptidase M15 [Acinetobacter sp.]